ncbi:GAF and ANTAR domain-containing protein [Kutzneria sp. CA-103260]|uniref:GAF and ANTAR domain-containing protein n=1 Tax=Kutzneria sp. CA-103260 TaxID=2802641 RepID=UPI001BAC8CA8|nr:GAF and ANTAR domain-containing protein [Kutzneria sp. CA-103260]QUQ64122.1 two-component system response regulator [Kutzneria sp. CA-103260]
MPAAEPDSVPQQLDDITEALSNLRATVAEDTRPDTVMTAVVQEVLRAVPGADMASVTVIDAAGPRTLVPTDERARAIDEGQYADGDGPCLRAARTGELTRMTIATTAALWPHFSDMSHRLGVGSYLAAPFMITGGGHGAINLFGFGDHGFAELDAKYLELYTVVAETALHTTARLHMARTQIEQLQAALSSRAVIEQAKGILMAARGLTEEAAFQELVDQSQRRNIKLRVVAASFVDDATRHRPAATD